MMLQELRRRLKIRAHIERWKEALATFQIYQKVRPPVPIRRADNRQTNIVSDYWNDHTVRSERFKTARESNHHINRIDREYPLYHRFMNLYSGYDNQVVVDYGCGPANDVVGFLTRSNAQKVIGIDVSEKGLTLAAHRISLHPVDPKRIELLLISDSVVGIPLEDNSVDYIHSQGVLHHSTKPEDILKEFYRILKPGCIARVMVYNYYSIFSHIWVAYRRMILNNDFPGLDFEAAFTKSTDGENCPISRAYKPEDFVMLCQRAGFDTSFVGGYFHVSELDDLRKFGPQAIQDERLGQEHRQFLRELNQAGSQYPTYRGKHAGVGGVYELIKR